MPTNNNCKKRMSGHDRDRQWPDDTCTQRQRDCLRRVASTQTVQDRVRVRTLQAEVVELRNLLLAHVDPDELRAAAELKRIMPSTAELLEMAETCGPPPCLENEPEEARPW